MKVVQILYSGLGGHGSVAFSLQAAAKRAWTGAATDWTGGMIFLGIEPLLPEYARLCAERSIPPTYVRARRGSPWRSWRGVFGALYGMRPDVIILHSVKTILPAWLFARLRGIPLIAVEHQPNSLKTRSEWVASRLLMRLADAVVVLTPDYHDALRRGLGKAWRADKVHLIPNGIDTDDFAPAPDRPPRTGRPVTVGMAARFSDTKRPELLAAAMAVLRERDGPDAWRLSLAGDGETRPGVVDQVAAAGLGGIVTLPGYLGAEALRDWFGLIDIYAHASNGETLSTSILQALAMGLPILGSDAPGISDLLAKGGGCGIVAAAQSGEAFADGLERLARDDGLAGTLAANARALAVRDYSQDGMFRAYEKVVTQACARSST